MGKQLLFGFAFLLLSLTAPEQFITRQGTVTFFSYTNVENIQATNNQVLSLFSPSDSGIAVSILMRAFVFRVFLRIPRFLLYFLLNYLIMENIQS